MMDIVKQYDDLKEIKEEINRFTDMLDSQKRLPKKNEIKAISKHIILMKAITNYMCNSHYQKCLIFDVLSTMHSLTQQSIRQFHYVFRSFIENYVRCMLNIDDTDDTGVNQLFSLINDKFNEHTDLIGFIYSKYSKSCLYVHSNKKSNSLVHLHYSEILHNDDFNEKTLKTTIDEVLLTLKKMVELLVSTYPNVIENSFYRRKQELEYLIGNKLYLVLLENINS